MANTQLPYNLFVYREELQRRKRNALTLIEMKLVITHELIKKNSREFLLPCEENSAIIRQQKKYKDSLVQQQWILSGGLRKAIKAAARREEKNYGFQPDLDTYRNESADSHADFILDTMKSCDIPPYGNSKANDTLKRSSPCSINDIWLVDSNDMNAGYSEENSEFMRQQKKYKDSPIQQQCILSGGLREDIETTATREEADFNLQRESFDIHDDFRLSSIASHEISSNGNSNANGIPQRMSPCSINDIWFDGSAHMNADQGLYYSLPSGNNDIWSDVRVAIMADSFDWN